ncbi:MAG: hypothetical protein IJW29_06195 [Clostridia bacterium]|nr:hypothetical protein [Clostridia bacterium]
MMLVLMLKAKLIVAREIKASLIGGESIKAGISVTELLRARIATDGVTVVMQDVPTYAGAYSVTPRVDSQSIPTAKTFMAEDMTVKAIPYYDVSNTSGGSTVYIGSEVEM